jgi:hypothetical protein
VCSDTLFISKNKLQFKNVIIIDFISNLINTLWLHPCFILDLHVSTNGNFSKFRPTTANWINVETCYSHKGRSEDLAVTPLCDSAPTWESRITKKAKFMFVDSNELLWETALFLFLLLDLPQFLYFEM